jgi:Phosphoribosyl transferase domain
MDYKWLVSSLLVVAGIAIGLWQYLEARRKQLLVDLQGDKNAVAAVAMRVRGGRFPRWSTKHRRELFEALCLAAVFQRSGRSRSLVYGALASVGQPGEYRLAEKYRQEIQQTVDRITLIVSRSSAYTDLGRARRMLVDLRAALYLDNDIRLRLDTFELNADMAREWPPDERLRHSVFGWPDLERLVRRLGMVVLVGPPEGSCPVIALDYHRVTRKTSYGLPERSALTPTGKRVIAAKYKGADDPTDDGSRLTEQLATVIETHPLYRSAFTIAAVPGSRHDFSSALGKALSRTVGKEFALLRARDDSSKHDPRFVVDDSSTVKGKSVIVVDDVYRSGVTLQAAATALRDAEALEVLGLAATSTISAGSFPCCHDAFESDESEAGRREGSTTLRADAPGGRQPLQ